MKKIKVLLVDDSELILDIGRSFLDRSYYEIRMARNGREAMDMIREFHPDVIFLDLHLPDISGDRICKAIKEHARFRETRVIVATGDEREQVRELCREVGCDDLLIKPVNKSTFVSAMVKVLGISARKQPRVPVKFDCIASGPGGGLVGTVLNISVLGVYLAVEPVPAVGDRLEMTFQVPPLDEGIVVKGEVKWNSQTAQRELPPGAGVVFVDLPGDIEDLIRDFVRSMTGQGA